MDKRDNKYIVNHDTEFSIENLSKGNIEKIGESKYSYLYKNKNHIIHLFEKEGKTYELKIDGYTFTIEAKDDLDLLIEKLGFNQVASQAMSNVKAPMPGLVLDIMVSVGDQIEKGDSLIILEAMKMENVIKAEGDGEVKSIEVSKGDKVDKGQIMIEL